MKNYKWPLIVTLLLWGLIAPPVADAQEAPGKQKVSDLSVSVKVGPMEKEGSISIKCIVKNTSKAKVGIAESNWMKGGIEIYLVGKSGTNARVYPKGPQDTIHQAWAEFIAHGETSTTELKVPDGLLRGKGPLVAKVIEIRPHHCEAESASFTFPPAN